jgi:hypothetical protein
MNDVNIIVAECSEAVNTASTLVFTILSRFLKLMSSKLLIVMSRLFDIIFDTNGGIIEKSRHFLTAAGQKRPFFSPANGQFLITTRRLEACRGIPPVPFDRARSSMRFKWA